MQHAKKIEVVLSGVALAVTLSAPAVSYAASACTTGVGSSVVGNTASFVKDTFTPKCSAGVNVNYTQSSSAISVNAAHPSGMHTFGGTSEGGGVIQCESSSVTNPTPLTPAAATNGCA